MGNYGHEDFLGFEFKGKHSSDFNLLRVSNGKRYDDNLVSTIQDKTQQIPGGNGAYWFNSYHTQKDFPAMNVAFDNLSEEGLRGLREWLNGLDQGDLIFDESPYKKYLAKVKSAPQFKYVCFDEENWWGKNQFVNSEFDPETFFLPKQWTSDCSGEYISLVEDGIYYTYYYPTGTANFLHLQQSVNFKNHNKVRIRVEEVTINQTTSQVGQSNYKFEIRIDNNIIYSEEVTLEGKQSYSFHNISKDYEISLNSSEAVKFYIRRESGPSAAAIFSIKNPQIFFVHNYLKRVYKGEGTIQFTAYKPYATSVYKYLDDYSSSNKLQWQGASRMLTSASAASHTLDAYPSDTLLATGTIYTYNPGDQPTDFKLYVTPPNTENETITISNGINSLTLTSIALQSGDARLVFDTGTQLIRSVDSFGNLTNHLYNRYITSGDFFKIPVSTTSTNYTPITITVSSASPSVAAPSIDYRYIYY